jgi:DNA replication protein DnaC
LGVIWEKTDKTEARFCSLANAVLDRLLHHSSVISIKGQSYRLKDKRTFLEAQEVEA